jgi:hypothetical protein
VLAGCNYWAPMGVHCAQVTDKAAADISVLISHESALALARKRVRDMQSGAMIPPAPLLPGCKTEYPSPDKITEAWCMQAQSNLQGEITMFPACMMWSSGHDMFSPAYARRIAAHEFGHELGVSHIPITCEDRCIAYEKDKRGNKLCGPAIMNPPSAEVDGITPMDAAGFGVRHPFRDPLRIK